MNHRIAQDGRAIELIRHEPPLVVVCNDVDVTYVLDRLFTIPVAIVSPVFSGVPDGRLNVAWQGHHINDGMICVR